MKGIIFMKSLTLSAIINNAKREHESFQKEINDITASLLLTQEGKKQKIDEIKEEYKVVFDKTAGKAEAEIDSVIKNMKSDRKKSVTVHLADSGYQIGLKNAADMIKSGTMGNEDVESIIDKYKGDVGALTILKGAINDIPDHSKAAALLSKIPVDEYEKNVDFLEKLKTSLSTSIRKMEGDKSYIGWLMGYVDTLENQLDDNYNLK